MKHTSYKLAELLAKGPPVGARSREDGPHYNATAVTGSFMSSALFVASVRKAIVLTLCIVSCCCLVSGCTGSAPNQTASSEGSNRLQASQISISSARTRLDEPVSIQATLKDGNGRVLNGKTVEWFIDGASVGKSQVNSGTTMMSLTSEYVDKLGIQTHQVGVTFYGDQSYESSTATSFLQIAATGGAEGTASTNSTASAV